MEIISMGAIEMADVDRDADQLPRAWPLLHVGENVVTRSRGMPVTLKLTGDDLQAIAEYHTAKGSKIPVDCRHVISNLAGKIGVDESDLVKRLPRYTGVAGFGRLEVRGDALYMADVDWLPIGREVMLAQQFRYYSPTVRGLDGLSPIRVTSVALTNEPHLQNVADLAAGETDDEAVPTPELVLQVQQSIATLKTEKKNMPEEIIDPNKPKIDDVLLALLKEVLGDDVTPENAKEKLLALKTAGEAATATADRIAKIEAAEEARGKREGAAIRKAALDKAYARGRLTPAQLENPFVKGLGDQEFADYVESLNDGCAAPVGTLQLGEDPAKKTAPKQFGSVREALAAAPVTDMKL